MRLVFAQVGDLVVLDGLVTSPELNGRMGRISAIMADGTFDVDVDGDDEKSGSVDYMGSPAFDRTSEVFTSVQAENRTMDVEECRKQLTQIYEEHNPSKMAKTELLLIKYKGSEAALLAAVKDKYGVA